MGESRSAGGASSPGLLKEQLVSCIWQEIGFPTQVCEEPSPASGFFLPPGQPFSSRQAVPADFVL